MGPSLLCLLQFVGSLGHGMLRTPRGWLGQLPTLSSHRLWVRFHQIVILDVNAIVPFIVLTARSVVRSVWAGYRHSAARRLAVATRALEC